MGGLPDKREKHIRPSVLSFYCLDEEDGRDLAPHASVSCQQWHLICKKVIAARAHRATEYEESPQLV